VVGFTDPEGGRSTLGALLLGYYDQVGKLHYAERVAAAWMRRSRRA
jgi:bifunctional non-homologous end joining protein LigD